MRSSLNPPANRSQESRRIPEQDNGNLVELNANIGVHSQLTQVPRVIGRTVMINLTEISPLSCHKNLFNMTSFLAKTFQHLVMEKSYVIDAAEKELIGDNFLGRLPEFAS
jgi:hypothetical protein